MLMWWQRRRLVSCGLAPVQRTARPRACCHPVPRRLARVPRALEREAARAVVLVALRALALVPAPEPAAVRAAVRAPVRAAVRAAVLAPVRRFQ